ncbi:hypothetical protein LXA43DRAFT_930733 [Ganoderma leucocontextum]|nr:hypothetical protein LXA43DRAFT_930733 [Ganoderma leucocontextum]
MPVTFKVASHPANVLHLQMGGFGNAVTVLKRGCEVQARQCKEMLQSSVEKHDLATIVPNSNGFVYAVLEAYGSHHHLRIRPDDVWLAILVQLNFYINAHAEELRSLFVAHEGKKRLEVKTVGDRYTVDYGKLAQIFTKRIHENVADDTLVEWILPNFTTTTTKDTTVCAVVMMATLKQYFEYFIDIVCGIPSVTLEGERSDWEEIYRRLWRLYDLGQEPAIWAEMLRPIIRRFITAFDGEPDTSFWSHVMYRCDEMCGQDDLSGWITAFCAWSSEGAWKGGSLPETIPLKPEYVPVSPLSTASPSASDTGAAPTTKRLDKVIPKWLRRHSKSLMRKPREDPSVGAAPATENTNSTSKPSEGSVMVKGPRGYDNPTYTLDGVPFFVIPVGCIPPGYCEVDVTVNDNGHKLDCMMVAGHVAFSGSSAVGSDKIDTVSPSAQWFIFEKKK